jgi:AcrR family transcriptional regulator
MEPNGLAALPARDRILLTAHDLFYRNGIRATGIDRIIAESGVAKLTFYRHFPSKDALIAAFLEVRHTRWMGWFTDALARHGAARGSGLAPVADALAEWFADPGFRGCAFINSASEIGGTHASALAQAREHKADMARTIGELLHPPHHAIANAATQAADGAIVHAQLGNAAEAVEALRETLRLLDRAAAS